jgi:uncharacterized protein (TIGR02466 family)
MSKPGQLHTLFPTCLYVADIDEAEQINAEMLPHIYALREEDLRSITDPDLLATFENEGWTTYFSRPGIGLINEHWTQSFQAAILEHVGHFVDMLQIDFGGRQPRVTTLFVNIHEELYHHHDAHTHAGSMFSGAYYVRAYPGAGRFRFVSPVRVLQFHEFKFRRDTQLNAVEASLDPVTGRMVMFHSHVPHAVDRPTVRGERIAIAFNVNFV